MPDASASVTATLTTVDQTPISDPRGTGRLAPRLPRWAAWAPTTQDATDETLFVFPETVRDPRATTGAVTESDRGPGWLRRSWYLGLGLLLLAASSFAVWGPAEAHALRMGGLYAAAALLVARRAPAREAVPLVLAFVGGIGISTLLGGV